MPQLNDDAIYLSGIEAQFEGTSLQSQVTVGWTFTVAASESFSNYDPSNGLVPGNFAPNGGAFILSAPSPLFTTVNISGVSGTNVSPGLKVSGSETTGSPQSVTLWVVYTKVS